MFGSIMRRRCWVSPWRWATGCTHWYITSRHNQDYTVTVIRGMGIGFWHWHWQDMTPKGQETWRRRAHTRYRKGAPDTGPSGQLGREATHHQPVPYGKPRPPLLAAPAHEGTERRGKWESQLQPDGRSSSKETKHNKAASQQERRVGNGLLNWLAILCSSAVNCALGSGVGWVLYEKHNWVPFLERSVLSFSQVRSATIQHQLT
jgi:hypothetical protein